MAFIQIVRSFFIHLGNQNPETNMPITEPVATTRQLVAIMFADIAGYTALMETDEARAMEFRDKLKQQFETEAQKHKGKIIKYSGDGVICIFDSASESVLAAIALQLAMQESPKVPLRIGIHQADVIFKDSDVFGDGVNIASRLESLAVPGSVFISAKVYDDIKNQSGIQSVSLGKYVLKNVKEPIEIFAISNPGLIVPANKILEGKAVKYKQHISPKVRVRRIMAIAVPVLAIALLAYFLIPSYLKKQNAKNALLPEIQKLVNDNFRPPTQAFDLALEVEKYIPEDSALVKLWPMLSTSVSISTDPEGVEVYWKDYDKPNEEWRLAGTTPLKNIRFPRPYLRMEFRKKNYQIIEYAGPWNSPRIGDEIDSLKMDPVGSLPENMVRIPGSETHMYIVGLEQEGGKFVGEFLIDRFEVTNRQFKKFVDANGYLNKDYWDFSTANNEKQKSFEEIISQFVDRTGRTGPSTWEAGMYPDGLENHPVTGISWYEANAYANWAGKKLPTVFHWGAIAATSRTEFIVPLSNFNGNGTTAVGSLPGYSVFGVYDVAGNAREWCSNESSDKKMRYILGGGFNDPMYAFNDGYMQLAFDRSISNGFRCMKELPGDTTMQNLSGTVVMAFRDYHKEKPVDDQTFEIYKKQFTYDKTPLNATVEETIEGEFWKVEKIEFDAGYNNEKMNAYLYLPKNFKPPFQTILFFPGSNDIFSRKYDPYLGVGRIDFLLKGGRAIIIPIYKGTHERHDDLKSDLQAETVFYKDHVIMWRKDIGRTLDYLETRNDIQNDKIGFLGWSWGGFMGGIAPALETRIKAVVLNVGGMVMTKSLPEVDQINFLPRVKQPVLMLNGKHDMFFPIETSMKPMFNFLGTPKDQKESLVYDSGHLVPRTEFVKETLRWFDKWLGDVGK